MPLAEYAKVAVRGAPLYETLLDRCVAWAEGRYKGWRADRLEAGLWGRQRVDVLLYGSDDGNDNNNNKGYLSHSITAIGLALSRAVLCNPTQTLLPTFVQKRCHHRRD
jgi:hypothetical protein